MHMIGTEQINDECEPKTLGVLELSIWKKNWLFILFALQRRNVRWLSANQRANIELDDLAMRSHVEQTRTTVPRIGGMRDVDNGR